MSKIVRLLFRFETEYGGDPRFISGNAFRHAISMQVNTSFGIFTNKLLLNPPKTYQEFFSFRTPKYFLHPYFELWYDKRLQKRAYRYFFLPEAVTFDILNPPENFIEYIKEKELIQLGRNRNCGFGIIDLQDYIEIAIDQLELPDQASHLTLISPALIFPSYVYHYNCRYIGLEIWNHNKRNIIQAIAPGQFFRIKGEKSIPNIAQRGILRKGLLGQFGLGEFVVHNWKREDSF